MKITGANIDRYAGYALWGIVALLGFIGGAIASIWHGPEALLWGVAGALCAFPLLILIGWGVVLATHHWRNWR